MAPAGSAPDPARPPETDLGAHYAATRARVTALLRGADEACADTPVPACPGWTVHDVVAHLVGNIEDGVAGRIQGIPTEALTTEQVDRHRDDPLPDLLETWEELSPLFEAALQEGRIWPAMIDAVTHEHDIRAAVGQPGDRDDETLVVVSRALAGSVRAPARVVVAFADGDQVTTGDGDGTEADADYELRTSAFELVRLRMGRRSRAQVTALDWSRDPAPILDHLFVFGPSPVAQVEPA